MKIIVNTISRSLYSDGGKTMHNKKSIMIILTLLRWLITRNLMFITRAMERF
jgi:hypothetical protein